MGKVDTMVSDMVTGRRPGDRRELLDKVKEIRVRRKRSARKSSRSPISGNTIANTKGELFEDG